MTYSVILYYKYVSIDDPEAVRLQQRALCERLCLKGRVLLAHEGINGTLAGTTEAIDAYIAAMRTSGYFHDMSYKRDATATVPFPRLRIKVRPEIVSLGIEVDLGETAPKLTPAQFHAAIKDPSVVLFDARNNYESAIGKFAGAVTPDIELFKDLPGALEDYAELKDKTVITYCTGGIRCEKASALMRRQGFNDVYQLEGGIIEYAKAYPEGAFEGECFVFDERMNVAFNEVPALLGRCRLCEAPTNTYRNCAYPACNALMLVLYHVRPNGCHLRLSLRSGPSWCAERSAATLVPRRRDTCYGGSTNRSYSLESHSPPRMGRPAGSLHRHQGYPPTGSICRQP